MVSDSVALKWAIAALNKKIEEKPDGGIKTKVDGREEKVKYVDILEELELLKKAADEERLKIVTFCNNCSAFTGGEKAKTGCCFKKEFTSSRFGKDFCSIYEIGGVQQRRGLY